MNKTKIIFAVFLFLFLINSVFTTQKFGDSLKISEDIFETFARGEEKVKVIIHLKDEVEEKNFLGIRNKNKKIDKKTFAEEFNTTYIAKTFNSISAIVTESEINSLIEKDYIKEVYPEPKFFLFLDDSTQLINANTVWGLISNGLNLTGAGQTICIIDSGVNYSHPDLGGCSRDEFLDGNCSKVVGGYAFYNNVTEDKNDVMGDSDHGTHVAGIAGANGSLKGVAPNVRIVAMKACGPNQGCDPSSIISSINWCIANKDNYNISIISFSLGTDVLFDNEESCNSLWPEMTEVVNNATSKNISVIAASGNAGNKTHISNPACISNVTAVGSIRKDDSTFDYNRNSLIDLVAPGVNINSAVLNGGYGSRSGTSMAAPHVSGAFAIINQYLQLTNRKMTPKQIEAVLNNTGKKINDSGGTNLNFSRIDIYSAILSLDVHSPEVFVSGAEGFNYSVNQTFYCNATDWQLNNLTFFLHNSSSLYYTETINFTGNFNETYFYINEIPRDIYNYQCNVSDVLGNLGASEIKTLTIGNITTFQISPKDNYSTNIETINFTCNSYSEEKQDLRNVTLFLSNSSGILINETKIISGEQNQTTFEINFTEKNIQEGIYNWSCLVFNNASYSYETKNRTIFYDTTSPNLTLISFREGNLGTSPQTNIFEFNVSDNFEFNLTCNLIINGDKINSKNISDFSVAYNFSESFGGGNYIWNINCSDLAGNINSSEEKSFSVSAPQQSSGGGGGGISQIETAIEEIEQEEIKIGTSRTLTEKQKIKFNVKNNSHTLTLEEIFEKSVRMNISSNPIIFILNLYETKKIDLNGDGFYDLSIFLIYLENIEAEIFIIEVNEKIQEGDFYEEVNERDFHEDEEDELEIFIKEEAMPYKKEWIFYFFVFTIFLIIFLILILILKINNSFKIKKPRNKIRRVTNRSS